MYKQFKIVFEDQFLEFAFHLHIQIVGLVLFVPYQRILQHGDLGHEGILLLAMLVNQILDILDRLLLFILVQLFFPAQLITLCFQAAKRLNGRIVLLCHLSVGYSL